MPARSPHCASSSTPATLTAERAARQAHVQPSRIDFGPLPFDAAARAFGPVTAPLRRAGRKPDPGQAASH